MPDKELKEQMYEVLEKACSVYQSLLSNSKAEAYLKRRGITLDSIERFRIGYAPGRAISTRRSEFPELASKTAGLIREITPYDGNTYGDVFFDRVVFPIFDELERVIGFNGRTLTDGPRIPKYVNTAETPLFKKGNILYGFGLKEIRQAIKQSRRVLIEEGPTDLIQTYQNGILNVVAPNGTALTAEQLKVLNRFSPDLEQILLFDGDEAGNRAAARVVGDNLGKGSRMMVCFMPEGEDPDSFLVKYGKMRFEEIIEARIPAFDYLLKINSKGLKLSKAEDYNAFLKLMKEPMQGIPEERRWAYVEELADKTGKGIEGIVRGIFPSMKNIVQTNTIVIPASKDKIRTWEVSWIRQVAADRNPSLVVNYFYGTLGVKPTDLFCHDVREIYRFMVEVNGEDRLKLNETLAGSQPKLVDAIVQRAKLRECNLDGEMVAETLNFTSERYRTKRVQIENSLLKALLLHANDKAMIAKNSGTGILKILQKIRELGDLNENE